MDDFSVAEDEQRGLVVFRTIVVCPTTNEKLPDELQAFMRYLHFLIIKPPFALRINWIAKISISVTARYPFFFFVHIVKNSSSRKRIASLPRSTSAACKG